MGNCQGIFGFRRGSDGLISAEDNATYERMEADVVALGKEIERLQRQAAIDAELAKATSEPIKDKPGMKPGDKGSGRASAEYQTAFWNAMRKKNYYDVNNALSIGEDAEGGYLVPDEFERKIGGRTGRGEFLPFPCNRNQNFQR